MLAIVSLRWGAEAEARVVAFTVSNPACTAVDPTANRCAINLRSLSITDDGATPPFLTWAQILIDGRVRLRLTAFFEKSISYDSRMIPQGLGVPCGLPNESGLGAAIGKQYPVSLEPLDQSGASMGTDIANVVCPAAVTTTTTSTSTTTSTTALPTTTTSSTTSTTLPTTTTSTTSTTLPTTGCDLAQLPAASFEGVQCVIAAIQDTLNGPPQLGCAARCKCALQPLLARASNLLAQAARASSGEQCKRSLDAARRAAKSFETRVVSLVKRRCLTPPALATMLRQESGDLATRSKALFKSAYCAGRP